MSPTYDRPPSRRSGRPTVLFLSTLCGYAVSSVLSHRVYIYTVACSCLTVEKRDTFLETGQPPRWQGHLTVDLSPQASQML
jgi:hypothetical protein